MRKISDESACVAPRTDLRSRGPVRSGRVGRATAGRPFAVLLTRLGGEIRGAEAVAKSYPAFFEDFAALGIKTEKIQENA